MQHVEAVVSALVYNDARMATKFVNEKMVVRATRRGKISKRDKAVEMVLTIGQPNFAERRFIKTCVKAGEKFPVKKIQLKLPRKAA